MRTPVRRRLVRAGAIAAISALLGLGGILDPTHAVLFGCLLAAGTSLSAASSERTDPDWPTRRFTNRAGGRDGVSDLAWQVYDTDRRVRSHVVKRVRDLAADRLALLGIDADDPARRADVERLLGARVAAGLASDRRPTARTLQIWLDAIDQLNLERTTR